MKTPRRITFAGKMWDVVPMACGYIFRLTCGDRNLSVNFEQ